jgi:hypothetical protein
VKQKRLDRLIENTLYEQPEEETPEEEEGDKEPEETGAEKEQEKDTKDIKDVEKSDLDDEEEEPEDEEIAVSIKFNDNDEKGGDIKLVSYRRLSAINSIESILKLFDIDPNNIPADFKDKIEITINSPVADFKDEEYKITLRDKSGEVSVYRPDFKTSIEKQSKTPLGQAVQQAVGEPGAEAPAPPEKPPIDLSYLPELETVFRRTVKNEFFDRILDKG